MPSTYEGAVLGSLPASASLPAADFPKRPMTGPGFSASAPVGGSFLTGVAPDEEEEEDTAAIPHRISKGIASPEQRRVSRNTVYNGLPATSSTTAAKAKLPPLIAGETRCSSPSAASSSVTAAEPRRHSELTPPLDAAAVAAAAPAVEERLEGLWASRKGGGASAIRDKVAKVRQQQQELEKLRAQETHALAKTAYRDARRERRYDGCVEALDACISVNAKCDVLHRSRSCYLAKLQSHERALNDARRAAILNPRGSANFYALGRCLQREQNLRDCGAAYLSAMRLGSPSPPVGVNESEASRRSRYQIGVEAAGVESRYCCLLETVRRKREYCTLGARLDDRLYDSGARGGMSQRSAIFDERKVLEEAFGKVRACEPDAPIPVLVEGKTRCTSAEVMWEEPFDGGEEIYLYVLQMSAYDVKWQADLNEFFDGFRPWKTVHEGPAKVMRHTLAKLKPGNRYKLRMMCKNCEGDSPWCDDVDFETEKEAAPGKKEDEIVPKSWLRISVPDVLQAHMDLVGGAPADFVMELATALLPNVHEIRRIFKLFASMGVGAQSSTELSKIQFSKFCRECGLMDGKNKKTGKPNGFKAMNGGEIDLLFQRVNATNLQSRRASWQKAQDMMGDAADAADGAAESLAREAGASEDADLDKDKDANTPAGEGGMAMKEFVCALVRLAWTGLGKYRGLGERLTVLLEQLVYPALAQALDTSDPVAVKLELPRCKAVLDYWDKDLKAIFVSYAAADMDVDAQDATDSINLAELMFMMNEGKLIDPNLTVSTVSRIFTHVNTQSEEEEGGDEDESELDYHEFKQVVVRICDAKIPEDKRGGEPFENTLQAWLQLMFVPTFRRILKDKARGLGSKTL